MSAHNVLQELLQADALLIDPGTGRTVQTDRAEAFLSLRSAGAETRVLAAPSRRGQNLTIAMDTDGGDVAVTQSGSVAFNQAGNTTITFNDAGDIVELVAITIAGVLRWRIKSNDGATLS